MISSLSRVYERTEEMQKRGGDAVLYEKGFCKRNCSRLRIVNGNRWCVRACRYVQKIS